jgi:hypothetical protein
MEHDLSAFVVGMRRQFGARAEEVARNQSENSTGAVSETWRSILHALELSPAAGETRSTPFEQRDQPEAR